MCLALPSPWRWGRAAPEQGLDSLCSRLCEVAPCSDKRPALRLSSCRAPGACVVQHSTDRWNSWNVGHSSRLLPASQPQPPVLWERAGRPRHACMDAAGGCLGAARIRLCSSPRGHPVVSGPSVCPSHTLLLAAFNGSMVPAPATAGGQALIPSSCLGSFQASGHLCGLLEPCSSSPPALSSLECREETNCPMGSPGSCPVAKVARSRHCISSTSASLRACAPWPGQA